MPRQYSLPNPLDGGKTKIVLEIDETSHVEKFFDMTGKEIELPAEVLCDVLCDVYDELGI